MDLGIIVDKANESVGAHQHLAPIPMHSEGWRRAFKREGDRFKTEHGLLPEVFVWCKREYHKF